MSDLFSAEVPEWDRGPRCPETGCGGPALPPNAGTLTLRCARCGHCWVGKAGDIASARAANEAWLNHRIWDDERQRTYPAPPREQWEARKLAKEREKVARIKEGRW